MHSRGETTVEKASHLPAGNGGEARGGEHRARRRQAILQLVRQHGGVRHFLQELDGANSAESQETLRYIIQAQLGDRLPLPPVYSEFMSQDAEDRFLNHACSKLRPTVRKLLEVDLPEPELEDRFLLSVVRQCERARRGFLKRYAATRCHALKDESPGRWFAASLDATKSEDAASGWFDAVLRGGWVPPHTARLFVLLRLWLDAPVASQCPLTDSGELDFARMAVTLGIAERELRRIVRFLRREAPKVHTAVPRPFRKVHQRLTEFASAPWGTLADAKLREALFDLARDLAFSFGPQDAIARGAKMLVKREFTGAIDLLLEERSFTAAADQRGVLERQMQRIIQICESLEGGNLGAAFSQSASFVLDAARIQHHTSPERLQVLLAYAHLLWLGRWYDACIDANRGVADRCDAIVRLKGEPELDYPPEFENGVSLRRVKTYAAVNALSCRFHHVLTGSPGQRFWVKDYEDLVGLVAELKELIALDPEATTVHEELLVVQSHVVRAAHNRHHGHQLAADERKHWEVEHQRQRAELQRIIDTYFLDAALGVPDVSRLLAAAQTGEGCAVERTLDVVEENLQACPTLAQEMRRVRLAAIRPPPDV